MRRHTQYGRPGHGGHGHRGAGRSGRAGQRSGGVAGHRRGSGPADAVRGLDAGRSDCAHDGAAQRLRRRSGGGWRGPRPLADRGASGRPGRGVRRRGGTGPGRVRRAGRAGPGVRVAGDQHAAAVPGGGGDRIPLRRLRGPRVGRRASARPGLRPRARRARGGPADRLVGARRRAEAKAGGSLRAASGGDRRQRAGRDRRATRPAARVAGATASLTVEPWAANGWTR
jgi:hypothetical protein